MKWMTYLIKVFIENALKFSERDHLPVFFFHVIVGLGEPLASQYRVILFPANTDMSLGGLIQFGGTAMKRTNIKINFAAKASKLSK